MIVDNFVFPHFIPRSGNEIETIRGGLHLELSDDFPHHEILLEVDVQQFLSRAHS